MRYALVLVLVVALAGCGRRHAQEPAPLRFEELPDTAQLSQGEPLLTRIEPYRAPDGALRIRGRVDFPEGTRIQLSIYRKGTNQMVARLLAEVRDHGFETPPILTARGPVPAGAYRFEYLALFNPVWQTPAVLGATDQGRSLRGPGVTRDAQGGATFHLVEERRL